MAWFAGVDWVISRPVFCFRDVRISVAMFSEGVRRRMSSI
jgi:hypothetical protein